MNSRKYIFIAIGVVIGLIGSYLNSDIHFYLIRNYVSAAIAIVIGFSVVFFLAPRKVKA